jgi:integrase
MASLPRAKEPTGRVPELPPALFWRIVGETPEHVRSCYVTLASTGMRVGEYLALDESHLRPLTREVLVPGTKTEASSDVISVGEEAWKHIVATVPSPVRYKWLYTHWKRACRACGAPDLTLHDLRHFYGQALVDAGRPEASVQQSLRHVDPTMTRRYTKRRDQGENALAMDEVLFPRNPKRDSKEA